MAYLICYLNFEGSYTDDAAREIYLQRLLAEFKDDKVCLERIFQIRFGSSKECPSCKRAFKYYPMNNVKYYQCQWCAHKISPTANTIFHKSSTSLTTWFLAIFLFSHSKNGVSAKEFQRLSGVTYKCAWRICNQIRKLFNKLPNNLSGIRARSIFRIM